MIFAHDKKTGRIRGKADIQTQPNPEPSRARSGAEGVETRGGRSVALNHPTRTRHAARREEIVQIRLVAVRSVNTNADIVSRAMINQPGGIPA